MSFGSTIALSALIRESRRFPRAVVQGAFAARRFTPAERLALWIGRRIPGTTRRLPFRTSILAWNNQSHFPRVIADRWEDYLEQNAQTSISGLAHRLDLLSRLDLRADLPKVSTEVLVLQGREDRIVSHSHYDEVRTLLPRSQGVLMPQVGHQPHYTHAEILAQLVGDFLLPCAPEGCPNDRPADSASP